MPPLSPWGLQGTPGNTFVAFCCIVFLASDHVHSSHGVRQKRHETVAPVASALHPIVLIQSRPIVERAPLDRHGRWTLPPLWTHTARPQAILENRRMYPGRLPTPSTGLPPERLGRDPRRSQVLLDIIVSAPSTPFSARVAPPFDLSNARSLVSRERCERRSLRQSTRRLDRHGRRGACWRGRSHESRARRERASEPG